MVVAKFVTDSSTFTPHPEGQFVARCIDVHDLGMIPVTFDGQTTEKHKIDIYFYAGLDKFDDGDPVLNEDGTPVRLLLRSRFTLSLHEKSRLRPFLEAWRGKTFTEQDEAEGFDLEKLINVPALIQVNHVNSGDRVYANITSIMRAPKDSNAPAAPPEYVRFCNRPTVAENKTVEEEVTF